MVDILLLLAMLGSPDFQERDRATAALEALTTYNHPVVLAGLRSHDPEVAQRCAAIQGRHRKAIYRRLQTVRWRGVEFPVELPGLEFLAWNPEDKSLKYTVWMSDLLWNVNWDYVRATRVYLDWLLERPGATEATARAVVRHLHGQRRHALAYWREQGCYDQNGEFQGPPQP